MDTSFVLNYFPHLREFYKTEKEFTEHLLSGEVKVSIPELIKLMEDYENSKPKLPSRFQLRQVVLLNLNDANLTATINAIHFYEGKVKYDLDVWVGEGGNSSTRVYNVDSAFVTDEN